MLGLCFRLRVSASFSWITIFSFIIRPALFLCRKVLFLYRLLLKCIENRPDLDGCPPPRCLAFPPAVPRLNVFLRSLYDGTWYLTNPDTPRSSERASDYHGERISSPLLLHLCRSLPLLVQYWVLQLFGLFSLIAIYFASKCVAGSFLTLLDRSFSVMTPSVHCHRISSLGGGVYIPKTQEECG